MHDWKRYNSSKLRNKGKKYTDRKGRVHEEKKVKMYNHECRYNCNVNVSEAKRQVIFDQYWGLGNWELQSSYLNSAIVLEQPRKKIANAVRRKSFSCQYYLGKARVCKEFFLKTLDISNKRITNIASKKKGSDTCISPRDKRGHKVPANKVVKEKVDLVKEHISLFPRYSSHYSRQQAPNRKYLNVDLNQRKMYDLYKIFCEERGKEPVTLSYYRHIFNTCFNLSFHRPHKDTCNNCDKFQQTIEHGTSEAKQAAITAKELHLRRAEKAKTEMDKAKQEVKNDESHKALCFDLQKMLPTPVLTCTKAYYSRQLWTYNFCVHDIGTGDAYMFLWHEGQASRGCEEIGSCLLQYINTLPRTVTHLTLFSDNCGGQNKSHFTVKFWLYVVNKTHIKTVDHKFLLPGHSYNHCDRNFGMIENTKRNSKRGVFVPNDWSDIIAQSNKKFLVKNMKDDEFLSLDGIQPLFVKSVKGIREMQWLQYRKNEPWTLFYKTTFFEDMPFSEYNMLSRTVTGRVPKELPSLLPKRIKKKIKATKYKDLLSLLPFVPPVHHMFYRSLHYEGKPQVQTRQNVSREDENCSEDVDAGTNFESENLYDSDSE